MKKIEGFIIVAFGILFLFWTASKCRQSQQVYQQMNALPGEGEKAETTTLSTNPSVAIQDSANSIVKSTVNPVPSLIKSIPKSSGLATLYVTIDSLKLRTGPSLDSSMVTRFRVDDEIYFLGKRSDFKQKINLEGVERNEPWILVKSAKGHKGWVYAGGVEFYK